MRFNFVKSWFCYNDIVLLLIAMVTIYYFSVLFLMHCIKTSYGQFDLQTSQ